MDLLNANDTPGEYPPSYYASTISELPPFPAAHGPIHTDVCIVGAGYTGLSAALHLARQGYDVVVLEAHRVGFGASGRNGGQVASGQRLDQSVLEARYGADRARALWQTARDARALVDQLVSDGIECDLRSGVIYATDKDAALRDYAAEAEHLAKSYGYTQAEAIGATDAERLIGTSVYKGGLLDHGAAHLNPLKLALGLAQRVQTAGAQIYERSAVRSLQDSGPHVILRTDEATISADHVVLAGNGYLGALDQKTAAHVMPINSYMIATEPLGDRAEGILRAGHAVADSRFVVNYFRLSPDGRLLFGGGESYGYRFARDIAAKVRRPMERLFPQLQGIGIDYAWGGTLALTRSRLPFVARSSRRVLTAGGYSGHGVALSLLAGRATSEAICGVPESFDRLAALPARPFPGGTSLRAPLLFGAMSFAALRDRMPF